MKSLFKALAIIIAVGGGVGLGFFVNQIINSNKFNFVFCLICGIIALIAGGFLLVAAFIYLWEKSNGDWDYKPDDTTKTDQTNE